MNRINLGYCRKCNSSLALTGTYSHHDHSAKCSYCGTVKELAVAGLSRAMFGLKREQDKIIAHSPIVFQT